jgi:hypothetical protein
MPELAKYSKEHVNYANVDLDEPWVVKDEADHVIAVVETEAMADALLAVLDGLRVVINLEGGIVQDAHCVLGNRVCVVIVDWEVAGDEHWHTFAKNGKEPDDKDAGYDLHAWVYSQPCWDRPDASENDLLVMADIYEKDGHPKEVTWEQVKAADAAREARDQVKVSPSATELLRRLSIILNRHQDIEDICTGDDAVNTPSAALKGVVALVKKANDDIGDQLKGLLPE